VFATTSFDLNIIFSSMLSIFELCQRKKCSCLIYVLDNSECYISCIAQHLEFIFCVIRNTTIKNSQDKKKRHMKFHLNLWLCPFKGIVSKLTKKKYGCAKNVAKWKIITKKSLQVQQNNYKYTGYANNYKMNVATSFLKKYYEWKACFLFICLTIVKYKSITWCFWRFQIHNVILT
jgi:hypothetical protein